MKISREQYYKDMAKALLKGYFVGLKEGRRLKKAFTSKEARYRIDHSHKEW